MMTQLEEIQRLSRIFEGYDLDPATQTRWDTHNPGNTAILRERQRMTYKLLDAAGQLPLSGRRVLEIGCGTGAVLAGMLNLGACDADLHGVDLLPSRVAQARRRYPVLAVQVANAEALPYRDAHFDLVLLYTLFSSILDKSMAANICAEVQRVLRPSGAVLWYDFRYNNPCNPHVRKVSHAVISQLFPGFDIGLRTVTVLPPLVRRLGRVTPVLYPLLAQIPPLRTHYLGLLWKRALV
jgi:ubiquinone/menaquinone biosynthesis C-methylase UbiE